MKPVTQRLAELRAAMAAAGCDVYIIPSSDPHSSEYVPRHFTSWEYFSGFSVENATFLITADTAALWVDGRFFGAADAALAGTGIASMHMGVKGVPTVKEYLGELLTEGTALGYCAECMPLKTCRDLAALCEEKGAKLTPMHLEDEAWVEDRPALPATPAWLLDVKYAGKAPAEKLAELRAELAKYGCTAAVITKLDSVAWLLNLRAADVESTPYALAFCYVSDSEAVLFMDSSRLPAEAAAALAAEGVTLAAYDAMPAYLAAGTQPQTVLTDPVSLNAALDNALRQNPVYTVKELDDPIKMMKAVKNETELACTRTAHLKDGAAMVRFEMELRRRLAAGEALREVDIDPILVKYRSMYDTFLYPSFNTIAAYGPNAAMMHYAPKPGADAAIEPRGFLLVDCGGSYLDGTTDITRTYAVGPLTEEEKLWYTLVLRCHIDVAMAVWKTSMTGGQLDMLARQPLWKHQLDYRCGTGHSVCHVGAVHEGPHSLRPTNTVAFVPGMVVTDEPGIYEDGKVGIRIENELECVTAGESEYGVYLKFEPITYAPIDLTAVLPQLLTAEEKQWLNSYHAAVAEKLASLLTEEENAWLRTACAPID